MPSIVLKFEVAHLDHEEASGGVIIQKKTSEVNPLVLYLSAYYRTGGPIIAEVLGVEPLAVIVVTTEVKILTFHSSLSFGYDTVQGCRSEWHLLVVQSYNHTFYNSTDDCWIIFKNPNA